MDFKQIQELIKTVNRSNIGEISVEDGEFKITIKQKDDSTHGSAQSFMPIQTQSPVLQQPSQNIQPQSATPMAAGILKEAAPKQSESAVTIKSPMIGTFYRGSSPKEPPFINIGDEINTGTTVCIIEAMKLFNEIESEIKGTIIKVLVDDASPVEYDQPLFLVEPA